MPLQINHLLFVFCFSILLGPSELHAWNHFSFSYSFLKKKDSSLSLKKNVFLGSKTQGEAFSKKDLRRIIQNMRDISVIVKVKVGSRKVKCMGYLIRPGVVVTLKGCITKKNKKIFRLIFPYRSNKEFEAKKIVDENIRPKTDWVYVQYGTGEEYIPTRTRSKVYHEPSKVFAISKGTPLYTIQARMSIGRDALTKLFSETEIAFCKVKELDRHARRFFLNQRKCPYFLAQGTPVFNGDDHKLIGLYVSIQKRKKGYRDYRCPAMDRPSLMCIESSLSYIRQEKCRKKVLQLPTTRSRFSYEEDYLIAFGGKYVKEGNILRYTSNDVEAIKTAFLEYKTIKSKKFVITNQVQSWSDVSTKISQLGKVGRLIFFFSGHGKVQNKKGLLMMDDKSPTWLHISTLLSMLKKTKARKILLIIDACQVGSDAIQKALKREADLYKDKDKGSQITFLLATQKGKDTYEDPRLEIENVGTGKGFGVATFALFSVIDMPRKRKLGLFEAARAADYIVQFIEYTRKRKQKKDKLGREKIKKLNECWKKELGFETCMECMFPKKKGVLKSFSTCISQKYLKSSGSSIDAKYIETVCSVSSNFILRDTLRTGHAWPQDEAPLTGGVDSSVGPEKTRIFLIPKLHKANQEPPKLEKVVVYKMMLPPNKKREAQKGKELIIKSERANFSVANDVTRLIFQVHYKGFYIWEKVIKTKFPIGRYLSRIPLRVHLSRLPAKSNVLAEIGKEYKNSSLGIWVQQREVTQKQFSSIMGYNPSYFQCKAEPEEKDPSMFTILRNSPCKSGDNWPVERVTWHEALFFANRLSQRLNFPRCFYCYQNGKYLQIPLGSRVPQVRCVLSPIYKKTENCKGYRLPTLTEIKLTEERGSRSKKNKNLRAIYAFPKYSLGNNIVTRSRVIGKGRVRTYHPGSLWEWTWNSISQGSPYRWVYGGSWNYQGEGVKRLSYSRHFTVGFRLVRTEQSRNQRGY